VTTQASPRCGRALRGYGELGRRSQARIVRSGAGLSRVRS
jgi:hypothetical protein